MFLAPVLAFALTLGTAIAADCGAYPLLATKLSKCATETAFCESLLGRAGTTTTVSVATYTKTVPKSTFTYLQVSTSTIMLTTELPIFYSTTVLCTAGATPAPDLGFNRIAVPDAAAAGSSCGVGSYSKAWVSEVCSCAIDSTVYSASTTKKVKKGTSLLITSSTQSYTTVSTTYASTATTTSTVISDNCYPPANSSCLYPGVCNYYNFYYCGSNDYYNCACGLDSHGIGTCFYADYCSNLPACENDYDCAVGSFCLVDSCCDGRVCSAADVCVGDQGTTTSPLDFAKPTPAPDALAGAMNVGAKVQKRGKVFMGMTPFGPRYE